jgi:hypothetical protein
MAGKRIAVGAGAGFEDRVWSGLKALIAESGVFNLEVNVGLTHFQSQGRHSSERRGLIYEKGKVRGYICSQNDFYNFMSQLYVSAPYGEGKLRLAKRHLQSLLSKNLLPDMAFFDYETRTIVIVEMKTQTSEGSVDEKLETVHFKRRQYLKFAKEIDFKDVKFNWALDSKFAESRYDDVKEYLDEMGSYFEVGSVSLDLLCLQAEPWAHLN